MRFWKKYEYESEEEISQNERKKHDAFYDKIGHSIESKFIRGYRKMFYSDIQNRKE